VRTLYEIIQAAKDGDKPTHDECYHAMLVLAGLVNLATHDARKIAPIGREPMRQMIADETHRRYSAALGADPVVYLGRHVPGNPEHDRFRAVGKKLVDAAIEEAKERR
jgi:hypothetical protein